MNFLSINEFVQGATQSYLDPGSGSMILQLILGAVLGLGVVVRLFWKNIKNFFTRGKAKFEEDLDPTAVMETVTASEKSLQQKQ
jgi:hypothetical protein